jgi:hypothetical protein
VRHCHYDGRVLLLLAALAAAALALGAVAGAATVLTAAHWRSAPHLAPIGGMLGLGAAGLAVFAGFWAHPIIGTVIGCLIIGASIVVLIVARPWTRGSTARAAVPGVLVWAGVLAVSVAFLAMRATDAVGFALVAEFMDGLSATPDNQLPLLVAQRLAEGESTRHILDNWNGSDRPPLLSGLILLVASPLLPFTGQVPAILALATGIVAQTLWVPALGALLRSLGSGRRATLLTVIALGLSGSTITNTLYTWPKLLSAAMILAACALLIDAVRQPARMPSRFVGAVALAVLGILSHGAALFTLPLLVALGLVALRGAPLGRLLRTGAVAAAAAAVLWLPWLAYQRFADPPGDRLLKWHLAGVIDEDSRSFGEALLDSYRALSPGDWIAGRLANLAVAFDPTPVRVPWCLCTEVVVNRRQVEFFTTMGSLGLALALLLVVLVVILVRAIATRRLPHADRVVIAVVGISAACIVFWCLLMFLPGTTSQHQGSHVWVLLLGAVGYAWLSRRHPGVVVALIGAQALLTLLLYAPPVDAVAPLGMVVLALGLTLQGLALHRVWRCARPSMAGLSGRRRPDRGSDFGIVDGRSSGLVEGDRRSRTDTVAARADPGE